MSKQLRIWLFVLLTTLLTSTSLLAEGVITMTTSRKVGEKITLDIKANGSVTIDGVKESARSDGFKNYTISTNRSIVIRGDVIELDCSRNRLTSLAFSDCTSLTKLNCSDNRLTSLDVLGCTSLAELDCSAAGDTKQQLTRLDLTGCTSLVKLNCSSNQLTNLGLSGCVSLTMLNCSANQLTSLDVFGCTALTTLDCRGNQLTSLDVSGCTALTTLDCWGNQLTSLDVSGCTALTTLDCKGNQLTSLDASGCTVLTSLDCGSNQLISLDVSQNRALKTLICAGKSGKTGVLSHLNVSGCSAMTTLDCQRNQLTSLDVSGCSSLKTLQCSYNQIADLKASGCSSLIDINYQSNPLTNIDLSGCDAFTSFNCKAIGVKKLNLSGCKSLVEFYGNSSVEFLDLSGCESLTTFSYNNNGLLKSLDVSNCISLKTLNCSSNQLSLLTLVGCTALTNLNCASNKLKFLDVSGCTSLDELDCSKNQLNRLVLSGCSALKAINASRNELTQLSLSGLASLNSIDCSDNRLISLEVSDSKYLEALDCSQNQIKGKAMLELVNSLPSRQGKQNGQFRVVDEKSSKEGNVCLKSDVALAKSKGWRPEHYTTYLTWESGAAQGWRSYEGSGEDPYVVQVKKTGEGSISVLGYPYLDAVPYGAELTIVAEPAIGYKLEALTSNGVDILESKRVTITESTSIIAVFSKVTETYAVVQEITGRGEIQVSGATNLKSVEYGTELTITATPATGSELKTLTANNVDIIDSKRITVKENVTIKAVFAEKSYPVTTTKEGEGTITARGADDLGAVPYGTELTIEATPAEGYELTALTANGQDILASKKVTIKGATEVKATFTQKTRNFVVTLTKEGEGTITATGADDLKAVPYGTKLTINATPAEGYELQSLVAGGVDITATKKIVVKDNLTVKATFTKKSFAVTLTKEGEGTISATGASNLNSVAYGSELTINATPAEGYELTALTANGTDILATKKIVVKDNLTVKATFAKKSFAVSLTKEGEGTITATGATSLNAVAYGTELTINATPAEGYELTTLTANGTDILATKKIVVKENLTVTATFTKKSFAVSLTKEGEGTITATGASNLNSVAYGTELTINATPAEGYELVSITAGGADILATKKIVVTDNLTIKAIFRKKTFAVKLTNNEHGVISIVEPVDLDAVPYGTTLTVKATGKNAQCELTALTANGVDILATKSFVVKGATEVKATFVDHTGVETTVTQQTQLYPNPATDYVIVEGVAPASEVTLHSMTGERLYAGRADDRGTLQIDLTPYADGVYLVCVAGETYRVVVRH